MYCMLTCVDLLMTDELEVQKDRYKALREEVDVCYQEIQSM